MIEITIPTPEEASKLYATKDGLEKFVAGTVKLAADIRTGDMKRAGDRAELRSHAHSIARVKVALDDAGKARGENLRAELNAVNSRRAAARTRLEALADEIRQPAVAWEEAEQQRKSRIGERIAMLRRAAEVPYGSSAASIQRRLDELGTLLGNEPFEEFQEEADAALEQTTRSLNLALEQAVKAEEEQRIAAAERAELTRLREQAQAREEEDRRRAAAAAEEERKRRAEAERAALEAAARKRAEDESRARIAEADRRAREAEARAAEETRRRVEAEKAREAEVESNKRKLAAAARQAAEKIDELSRPLTGAAVVDAIRANLIPI